jgi:2-polyprenyl-3-methyl-5-hydroxy-6-metoxy-1,4-benzoquinol methylase
VSFRKKLPSGFDGPILLPKDERQREEWQEHNRNWWQRHPMRYDWKSDIGFAEFTPEFYQEIDRRFFTEARKYIPWHRIPFDSLVDMDALRGMDVLEIGVGCGSHAQLLASHAKSYTGIDLTDYAVRTTSRRLRCFGL